MHENNKFLSISKPNILKIKIVIIHEYNNNFRIKMFDLKKIYINEDKQCSDITDKIKN